MAKEVAEEQLDFDEVIIRVDTLDFTQSNAWEPYPEQPKWQPHTSKAASRSNNFFMYSVDGATTKHNELAKYDYNLNFATLQ